MQADNFTPFLIAFFHHRQHFLQCHLCAVKDFTSFFFLI